MSLEAKQQRYTQFWRDKSNRTLGRRISRWEDCNTTEIRFFIKEEPETNDQDRVQWQIQLSMLKFRLLWFLLDLFTRLFSLLLVPSPTICGLLRSATLPHSRTQNDRVCVNCIPKKHTCTAALRVSYCVMSAFMGCTHCWPSLLHKACLKPVVQNQERWKNTVVQRPSALHHECL